VIGTTGFTGSQQVQITRTAEKVRIVQSPNMSIGANLCMKATEWLSQRLVNFGVKFDVGITEIHHNQKQDQPSGTALQLGQIAEASGYRGKVQYASLRLGDISGEHQVIFSLKGEQLVVRHHADTRENFALGALQAAEWILTQKRPGLYGMAQVLGLDDNDIR
jgi:4-hydroxy-tetrahydrodipicolinate reductase